MTVNVRRIDGRGFHNSDSNYSLPGDSVEHQRLGVQHRALKEIAGGNYLAPLQQCNGGKGPTRIVDLCCGSGHWAIDMAQEFPAAEVIGLDIMTPKPGIELPPNCTFVIGDAKSRLPLDDASVDYFQMRTVPSIPERKEILKEIGRVLKPGGFIGFIEPNESFSATLNARSPALIEVDRLLIQTPHAPLAKKAASKGEKKSWSIASKLSSLLQRATDDNGMTLFDGVEEKSFQAPIGSWPEDPDKARIGASMGQVQLDLVKALGPMFLGRNLLTVEEFDDLFEEVQKEVADHSLQLQMFFTYAWGRRRQKIYRSRL